MALILLIVVSSCIELFQESQGIDIDPAAGVAFATLLTAA
jgi:hypothetical protein